MIRIRTLLATAVLTLALGLVAATAQAAPRYVNKDAAQRLARTLDKGVFKERLITSTFIQSVGEGRYYIKVVLDNGAEQEWNLEQIRAWSKDGSLTLQKNRVLVFTSETTNDFGVLDKSQFSQRALISQVYAKEHDPSDILAGRVINYGIFEFNLVDLLNLAPGSDSHGYPYEYVLDLANGQREYLSYRGAFEVMNRGALYPDPDAVQPVLYSPYRLEGLGARELEAIPEDGVGKFGVRLRFDRAVALEPRHYPFQLYERTRSNGQPFDGNEFVLEVTAPNAVIAKRGIEGIRNLEYLKDIHVVSDDAHQNRVLLRANVNPAVLATPPEVEVQDEVVTVVFTKVEDQTVFDRQALREAQSRRRQEEILAGKLSEQEVEKRRRYMQAMDSGQGLAERADVTEDFSTRYDLMTQALAQFRSAAANASSDAQLQDALRARNRLNVKLPNDILSYVRTQLEEGATVSADQMLELLDHASVLTRDPQHHLAIQELQERLRNP